MEITTNTANHAKRELFILFDSAKDPLNRPIIEPFADEIIKLCEKFGLSGQSGGSSLYTAKALSMAIEKLCLQETIAPLTGDDDEWNDVTIDNGGKILFQNKRDSAVFKTGEPNSAYYIDAIVFNGDIGGAFTGNGSVKLSDGTIIGSQQLIKEFPFTPKRFYVDVIDHRWKDKEETTEDPNGDWWTHTVKDESQLKEVFEYYNRMFL